MKIVVTHIKPDFDAISSAWAAYRMYDCDCIMLASTMDPNVEAFFEHYGLPEEIRHVRLKEIDEIEEVEHLVITDCKQRRRLGELERLVDKAKRITIVDHHPDYGKDIFASEEYVRDIGASVSILVDMLIKGGIPVSATDATLYMLGIYEDTGMLSFSSTTPDDARAVASLIEYGGDVSVINDFVKRELSREQIFILNELLMNMSLIKVDNIDIACSFASIDKYTEELAYLARRMMDMEGLNVLFIMVRSGPNISLIGRSKNPQVDVGKVVSQFGGGGHAAAAAVSIRNLELYEAFDMLKVVLMEQIQPVRYLKEIVTSPAKAIDVNDTIAHAMDFTVMHNLNHMPVTEGGRAVGILSRKDIMHGIKLGLSADPVSLLMQTGIEVLSIETPFKIAEEVLLRTNQKLIPVEKNDKLFGVVTRTDLLRMMHEDYVQRSSYEKGAKDRLGLSRYRNVTDLLEVELNPTYYTHLKNIGQLGKDEGVSVYIAGGFVRDLLMGRSGLDIDIVVESDAVEFATRYTMSVGAKVTIHEKYRTATVHLPTGEKIDFASARTEYYNTPGALPSVDFSSIRRDLIRRDFTINAMAIRLDGDYFGQLIDFFGGQRDILDRKLRVLHSLSFVDDPTRAFRAVRFAGRLGFELAEHTERLIKHAEGKGLFRSIQGSKLYIEIKLILKEATYMRSLHLLKKYNMLKFIAEGLTINQHREAQFGLLEQACATCKENLNQKILLWRMRFVLLLNDYVYPDFKGVLESLSIPKDEAQTILSIFSSSKQVSKRVKGMKTPRPSELYEIFSPLSEEELILTAVLLGESRMYIICEYFEVHRKVKASLNGQDLVKMGIPESALLGQILKELKYAKLDGEIAERSEEEAYVRAKYIDK